MLEPARPADENERLAELLQLCVLDTLPEERFDRVTRTARFLFKVDFVLVSLVDRDRQWFKSDQGLGAAETPRNVSFCGHAILSDAVFVVEDAAADIRFADNPLVTGAPHIRFYAGVPLHGPNGYRVGTLCIIDRAARTFGAQDVAALIDLGAMIDSELNATTLERAIGVATDSEARLRAIVDNVVDGIITTDDAGGVETMNGAALRIFGYALHDVAGRNIAMLMSGPAQASHPWGGATPCEAASEVSGKRKDCSLFPLEIVWRPMTLKGSRHFTCIVRDLSERKRVEAIQAQFAAIIASSSDAVMSKTLDGEVTSWNVAAAAMFGYAEAEIIGHPMSTLIPCGYEDEEPRLLARIRTGARIDHFETVRQRKNGDVFPVSVTISPIKDAAGKIIGASTIARDITELQTKQKMLIAAKREAEQANQAKSEFLANMSHEIRTPMNAVLGMAHLLGTTELSDEQRRYLEMIRISGKSLLDILNDVLDFSKIEAGKMALSVAPFRLDDVLHALATIMSVNAGEKDLELAIGVDAGVPPMLVGDALRLQQVLINLTGNAIKFTEAGEVTVQVQSLARQDDAVTLRFAVRDTGIGMSEQEISGLFLPFTQADSSVTRRFGGTGLGLTISRRLVDMMGGVIDVHSAPGRGSEFFITLTLPVGTAQAEPQRQRTMLGDLRVLLVDDNATSRLYLRQTIEAWQWDVDSVASGEQALERVRARLAAGQNYDVVLIDWKMPGMDGVATMRAIRALTPEATVRTIIMVSAFGRGQLMADRGSSKVDALLTKPATASSLFDTIHEILAGDAARAQPYLLGASKRIDARLLLVEDNRLNQVVAKGILEQAGATVDVADNGQHAVELLRKDGLRYDLVLMDVQMPVMDGFTATRRIREQLGLTLPILAMTAGVLESERAQCAQAGMDDFIGKPIDVEQLFAAIGRHLPANRVTGCSQAVAAAPAPAQDAVFDVEQLFSIAGGSAAFIDTTTRLIRTTVDNGAAQIAAARQAWDDGRVRDAAIGFHTLRGSVGMLGAARFMRAASDVEAALRDGADAAPLFARAEQEMSAVAAAAHAWLAAQATPVQPEGTLAPDGAQLVRLKLLLVEQDMGASDLYALLRPAMRAWFAPDDFAAIDSAMECLAFDAAAGVLERVLPAP